MAILNGGSVRSNATYGPGAISKRDVISILPFETPVVKIETTGAAIRAALEHGVSRVGVETEFGGFPQISGIRFSYDARKAPGARVVEVTVMGSHWMTSESTQSRRVTIWSGKAGMGMTCSSRRNICLLPKMPKWML